MATSLTSGHDNKLIQGKLDLTADSITGLEEKCNVRTYGDITRLINESNDPTFKREFLIKDKGEEASRNDLSRYEVTCTQKLAPGQLVGFVKGKVCLKDADKKKAPFPVFSVKVRAKPDDGAAVEMLEDTPTLEMKDPPPRQTRQKQEVNLLTILADEDNNPLGRVSFHSNKSMPHNSRAVFVRLLNMILLCLVATKEINPNQPIVVFSNEISLYETWSDYSKRMAKKRKGSASSAASSTESVGSGRSKKKMDEPEDEVEAPLPKKTRSKEEVAPPNDQVPNDPNPAIQNAAKILLQQKTKVARTMSGPQSLLRDKQKNDVDEARQNAPFDATAVNDPGKVAAPVRVTRSRNKLNVENEPPVPEPQAGPKKKQVQKTVSAPPETAQGAQALPVPPILVDENVPPKTKLRRVPSKKTVTKPVPPQAVTNQNDQASPSNVRLHPTIFENPDEFNLRHVGMIFHQSEPMKTVSDDLRTNFGTVIEQERARRKRHADGLSYVNNAKKQLTTVCKCMEVDHYIDLSFEAIKKKLMEKINKYSNNEEFVSDKRGIRMFIVFTSPLVDGTRIYFTDEKDSADLFKDIILPLFEVKNHKPQRIFPFILLDASLGGKVANPDPEFELLRWSPAAPNEICSEHCAGLGLIDVIKEFEKTYKDKSVKDADVAKVLQNSNCSHFQGYLTSDEYVPNYKLSFENNTTKPFVVDKPIDINEELQDQEIKGYYYVVQHCSQGEKKSSFRVMNNILLELGRYLNVKRIYFQTDFYDDENEEFKNKFKKIDDKYQADVEAAAKEIVSKLGKLKYSVKIAEGRNIAKKVPGFKPVTMHHLPVQVKKKVVKPRMKEFFADIKRVARYCMKKGKPYMVLAHHCKGDYKGFILGDLTKEDLKAKPLLFIPYDKVYEKVRKYGIKKLIILALHFDPEFPCDQCLDKYKTEYPRISRGGTPSSQHLSVEHVRIETNMPQYALLTACLQGSQLPNPTTKNDFSPFFPTLEKVYQRWAKDDPMSPHTLTRAANKISSNTVYNGETLSGPDSNVGTKCFFVLNTNMIFEDKWIMK